MSPISELRKILSQSFAWNKSRLDCFSRMLLALISVRTVNLKELAVAFESKASIDSRYKRLKRFFANFKIDTDILAKWLFWLFFSKDKKVYLTIDRTNWFIGKAKVNILTLGVCYEGIAIPLFWKLLKKAGNAKASEHKTLIKRFIRVFGKERIVGLLGDREFATGELFKFLNREHIPFYIRIKDNTNIYVKKKKMYTAKKLFKHLTPRKQKTFPMSVWIFGQKVYLSGSRSERGELMVVASNSSSLNAIVIYLRRWEIESLFQALKGRGFRLEDTHISHPDRLSKMMALLAVAFSWLHKIGEWRAIKKPIVFNKYRNSRRPQYSYFRYGFEFIRDVILHIKYQIKAFKECLRVFSPPNFSDPSSINNILGAFL